MSDTLRPSDKIIFHCELWLYAIIVSVTEAVGWEPRTSTAYAQQNNKS